MKHSVPAAILLFSLSSMAGAANYATCLLEKLPGLENDQAATPHLSGGAKPQAA